MIVESSLCNRIALFQNVKCGMKVEKIYYIDNSYQKYCIKEVNWI